MKNYIGFVNDHSGSMSGLAQAAMKDYNTNIDAVVNAANSERLDTVVSVIGFGISPTGGYPGFGQRQIQRQVVISNPHVLHPKTEWPTPGGTPLYDAVADMIDLFESLPDANSPDVSFLIMVTTDGQEQHSKKWNKYDLSRRIAGLNEDGRWTLVFRVPRGKTWTLDGLNIPAGNIQEWDTTTKGMEQSTKVTTAAVDGYFRSRSAGAKQTNTFYSDASKVDISSLKDITSEVSLYVVEAADVPYNGRLEIRDFILSKRMNYLKGAAFYQLTKTESRVSHTKQVLVQDRKSQKIYAGKDARAMINLPSDRVARLHPGDHKDYNIFIQSESTNRLLVPGTGVVYWEKVGVPFTQAELDKYAGKKVEPVNVAQTLPKVEGRTKPTPSPVPKKAVVTPHTVNGLPVTTFVSREDGRKYARRHGVQLQDAWALGYNYLSFRWFVYI